MYVRWCILSGMLSMCDIIRPSLGVIQKSSSRSTQSLLDTRSCWRGLLSFNSMSGPWPTKLEIKSEETRVKRVTRLTTTTRSGGGGGGGGWHCSSFPDYRIFSIISAVLIFTPLYPVLTLETVLIFFQPIHPYRARRNTC